MAAWGKYGGRLGYKASQNGKDSPECLKALLEKGAEPNVRDLKGKSPLAVACRTGAPDCIGLLVAAGADVND